MNYNFLRFIMAEEVYLNQKIDTVVNKERTSSSRMSSQSSDSHVSSCSTMSEDQNRLLRVVQRKPSAAQSVGLNLNLLFWTDRSDTYGIRELSLSHFCAVVIKHACNSGISEI